MKTKLLFMLCVIAALSVSATAGEPNYLPIENAGFEVPIMGDGLYYYSMTGEGWGFFGNEGVSGAFNPGKAGSNYPAFGGNTPEGENCGWTTAGGPNSGDGGLAQVLTETFEAGAYYQLSCFVANNPYYDYEGYKVQLLAGGIQVATSGGGYAGPCIGGTVIAEDDSSVTPNNNRWLPVFLDYSYLSEHAALVGEPLQIRLLAKERTGTAQLDLEVNFDDVKLAKFYPPLPVRNPWPRDRGIVPTGTVDMTWDNAHSTTGDLNASVEVDLYFEEGAIPSGPGDRVLDGITDANSWTTPSELTEGFYYWRVETLVDPGPPKVYQTGPDWVFEVNDLPPEPTILTPDKITWENQSVSLSGSVADDGSYLSPVEQKWTANPSAEVTITNDTTLTPTFTFTGTTPGDPNTVTVTFAARDAGNPTWVEETMTIDVYNTDCSAALAAGKKAENPTDIAGDQCTTDLEDLALAVTAWLNDTATLTGPTEL